MDEDKLISLSESNGLRLMRYYEDAVTFKHIAMGAISTVSLGPTEEDTVTQALNNFEKLESAKKILGIKSGPCGDKPCPEKAATTYSVGVSTVNTVVGLAKAAVDLAKGDFVTAIEYRRRMLSCLMCMVKDEKGEILPRFDDKLRMTCGAFLTDKPLRDQKVSGCGCHVLELKAKLASSKCPLEKW